MLNIYRTLFFKYKLKFNKMVENYFGIFMLMNMGLYYQFEPACVDQNRN